VKPCAECGTPFSGHRCQRYCRPRCKARVAYRNLRKRVVASACRHCGATIRSRPAGNGPRKFCGPDCAKTYRREHKAPPANRATPPDPLALDLVCRCGRFLLPGTDHNGRLVDYCAKCGPRYVLTRRAGALVKDPAPNSVSDGGTLHNLLAA